MKIKMLETRRGSEDAFSVKLYEEGNTYDVGDTLARSFIRSGWATEVQQEHPQLEGVSAILADTIHAVNRLFAPQPTRGTAPQNPATLISTGKAEA